MHRAVACIALGLSSLVISSRSLALSGNQLSLMLSCRNIFHLSYKQALIASGDGGLFSSYSFRALCKVSILDNKVMLYFLRSCFFLLC